MALANISTLIVDNQRVVFDGDSLKSKKSKKTVSNASQDGATSVKNTYYKAALDHVSFDMPYSVSAVDVFRLIESNDLNGGTNVGIITPEYSFTLQDATLDEDVELEIKPEGKINIVLVGVRVDASKIPG